MLPLLLLISPTTFNNPLPLPILPINAPTWLCQDKWANYQKSLKVKNMNYLPKNNYLMHLALKSVNKALTKNLVNNNVPIQRILLKKVTVLIVALLIDTIIIVVVAVTIIIIPNWTPFPTITATTRRLLLLIATLPVFVEALLVEGLEGLDPAVAIVVEAVGVEVALAWIIPTPCLLLHQTPPTIQPFPLKPMMTISLNSTIVAMLTLA